jgi:hypothetical protein
MSIGRCRDQREVVVLAQKLLSAANDSVTLTLERNG